MSGLLVCEVESTALKSIVLGLLAYEYSHSGSVERIQLCEIHDVELNRFAVKLWAEVDREIKPLMVSFRVCVHSHVEIVHKLALFIYHVEVTTFEI